MIVNILLNIIIGIAMAFLLGSQDFARQYFTSLKQLFTTGILVSTLLTLPIFLGNWKKLRKQEDADEFPDLNDPKNIKSFQIIFIIFYIILLVASYTLSQMYSKVAGSLCFVAVLVLGGVERFYIQRNSKKAQQAAADGQAAAP